MIIKSSLLSLCKDKAPLILFPPPIFGPWCENSQISPIVFYFFLFYHLSKLISSQIGLCTSYFEHILFHFFFIEGKAVPTNAQNGNFSNCNCRKYIMGVVFCFIHLSYLLFTIDSNFFFGKYLASKILFLIWKQQLESVELHLELQTPDFKSFELLLIDLYNLDYIYVND